MTKIRWRSGPAIKQNFPFHDNLIYYISMNPSSSKAYNKMVQCCKFFFEVNPILVFARMCEPINYKVDKRTQICSKEKHEKKLVFDKGCCIKVDLTKITSKIWITYDLVLHRNAQNFSSLLCAKIYRCEITQLSLFKTNIPFNDFKFLVHSVKNAFFTDVKFDNGDTVFFEAILKALPNAENIFIGFKRSRSTITKIEEVPQNLKTLTILGLNENFNITDFYAFSKEHKRSCFCFYFDARNMPNEYQNQLKAIIASEKGLKGGNMYICYKEWAFRTRPTFGVGTPNLGFLTLPP